MKKTTYRPLPYGSREWIALRKTLRTSEHWDRIGNVGVLVECETADAPGLWVSNTAVLYTVSKPGGTLNLGGLGRCQSTVVLAHAATKEEAMEKAAQELAK